MLLYEKLHWCLSTTYCRAVDVFLVLGSATNFYWRAWPIFCLENLIFHLKKGHTVNYLGHVPFVPLQCLRLHTIPPRVTADFSEKVSLRTRCYCLESNVKHELPNSDFHLKLSNLTLVSNKNSKNKIRKRYLSHLIQFRKTHRLPLT